MEERKKRKPMFCCGFSMANSGRMCSQLSLADFSRSGELVLRAVKVTFEAWQRKISVDFFKVHTPLLGFLCT